MREVPKRTDDSGTWMVLVFITSLVMWAGLIYAVVALMAALT
jgi:hypothetical protein